MRRFTTATVVYVIITMGFAYSWHLLWFHDLYRELGAVTRPEPIVPLGLLTVVIHGAVIAYLFPYYLRGKSGSIAAGLRFSFIIGLIPYGLMALATPAKFAIEPVGVYIALHTAFHLLVTTANGMALGWIYRGPANSIPA